MNHDDYRTLYNQANGKMWEAMMRLDTPRTKFGEILNDIRYVPEIADQSAAADMRRYSILKDYIATRAALHGHWI